ncbi:MAG: FtsX-like permease family protein [Treponemataceae bacterium]|nr:FtsX-like permease family protein [Treponemataceae bacterium]
MNDTLKMSMRSIIYRKKQYVSLFLVCLFGIGVSIFSIFTINGMLASLKNKAKIYYGGDYQFMGGTYDYELFDYQKYIDDLKGIFPEDTIIAPRFDYNEGYVSLYFEGVGVRQRVIKGVDFNLEKELFSNLNFKSGSIEDMAGSDGILLSAAIADILEVSTGDSITMMIRTKKEGINTAELVVKGIFTDSSLFGMYTSYMDIDCLKNAYRFPENCINRICITLPKEYDVEKMTPHYQSLLESKYPMYKQVNNKQLFYDHRADLGFPNYGLITLEANLNDVQILINAMNLISSFVIIILMLIVIIGVSSTFRVIVIKRINEIGIYKAIGMRYGKIMGTLLTETGILLAVGCISGLIFALILCFFARFIKLSFIPAFDIFLTNGVLAPSINIFYFLILSAAIIVTTLIAVFFRIRKSVAIPPCEALATTE